MEWIRVVMDRNIQSLMLLRLAFSPRVDADYPKLVSLWTFAFSKAIGRIDQQLDEPRINKAFGAATVKLTSWPSPAQIIELMPRRPEVQRLNHDPRDFEPMPEGMLTGMLNDILAKSKGLREVE